MRARGAGRLLVLALAALGVARAPSAAQPLPRYKIIVNPDNPIAAANPRWVRDAFLKKATEWSDHSAVHPIDLTWKYDARVRFTQGVIHKTPAQVRTYWNQQIFTGKGVPPPEVDSVAQVIAYVVATKGAVGYIPVDDNPGQAKVIGIR